MNKVQKITTWILVGLAYIPTFLWMWEAWFDRDSYYSHGPLVPFITGILIYQKKDILKKIGMVSSPWGIRLFIIGISVHILSSLLQVHFTSGFSLLIVILGLVLHFYGADFLKVILFPLSFLIFALPLPSVVVVNMSFQLKLLATHLATMILHGLSMPALQVGSVIKLRHTYVIVEDLCSGLRSLIALLALASLFAYWLKAGWAKKIFLFLLGIPIAIITNALRIVAIAMVSEIYGTPVAMGSFHEISGYLALGLAFGFLCLSEKLLE